MYRLELVATEKIVGEVVDACLGLDGVPVRLVKEGETLRIYAYDLAITVPPAARSARSVDVLGDQFILVKWRASPEDYRSFEENAWIINSSGELVRALALTGRFSGIATDYDRRIWTRYEDQAGFWMPPPGANNTKDPARESYLLPGAVRWNETGAFDWVLSEDGGIDPPLIDCGVMNCSRSRTFFAIDHDNSLLCLSQANLAVYPTPVQGPMGLAVVENKLALLGKYEQAKRRGAPRTGYDVLTVGEIIDQRFTVTDIGTAVMPDGSTFPRPPRVMYSRGRSILMHFGDPSNLYMLSVY